MTTDAQLLEKPLVFPNYCAKCRADETSPRQYFMDIGVDIPVYDLNGLDGRLYLCDACLYDIVTKMPDAFTEKYVNDLVSDYHNVVEDARSKVNFYNKRINYLKSIGINLEADIEETSGGREYLDEFNEFIARAAESDEAGVGENFSTELSDDSDDEHNPSSNPLIADDSVRNFVGEFDLPQL